MKPKTKRTGFFAGLEIPLKIRLRLPKTRHAKVLNEVENFLMEHRFDELLCAHEAGANHFFAWNVRVFNSKQGLVAIKDVRGHWRHGADYGKGVADVHAHNHAKQKGKIVADKYTIFVPKVYGVAYGYLVMEFVPNFLKEIHEHEVAPDFKQAVTEARKQMVENFRTVFKDRNQLDEVLQTQAFMPLGMHNGRVVFSAVYDYF